MSSRIREKYKLLFLKIHLKTQFCSIVLKNKPKHLPLLLNKKRCSTDLHVQTCISMQARVTSQLCSARGYANQVLLSAWVLEGGWEDDAFVLWCRICRCAEGIAEGSSCQMFHELMLQVGSFLCCRGLWRVHLAVTDTVSAVWRFFLATSCFIDYICILMIA